MPKYKEIIIYEWPVSQICIGCEHGEYINSETYCRNEIICFKNEKRNDGISCPSLKPNSKPECYLCGDTDQNHLHPENNQSICSHCKSKQPKGLPK